VKSKIDGNPIKDKVHKTKGLQIWKCSNRNPDTNDRIEVLK
jgi:hypothetical protein